MSKNSLLEKSAISEVLSEEFRKEFVDIQATIACGFTLKCVRDILIKCSQMHRADKLTTQLNHLASLSKWLSVCLRTKWLWVGFLLQSLKTSDITPVSSKGLIDIHTAIECGVTLKFIRDILIRYSHI